MDEFEFMRAYSAISLRNKSPLVSVDTRMPDVIVPQEFIEEDGTILLDISPHAVRNLEIINDIVRCKASFSGNVFSLAFPLARIIMLSEED